MKNPYIKNCCYICCLDFGKECDLVNNSNFCHVAYRSLIGCILLLNHMKDSGFVSKVPQTHSVMYKTINWNINIREHCAKKKFNFSFWLQFSLRSIHTKAKANATAKRSKEQAEKIREKSAIVKRNFCVRFLFGVIMPLSLNVS